MKYLPIILTLLGSAFAGIFLHWFAFAFAWGTAEVSLGMASQKGVWIIALIALTMAALVSYFAAKRLGRYWWVTWLLVVLPPLWFYTYVAIDNYRGGNPGFLWHAMPSSLVVISISLLASLIGRSYSKSNSSAERVTRGE